MTQNEFQKRYHEYMTKSEVEAKEEADKVNKEGIENDRAVAINFGNLGWALMLKSAADFAEKNSIILKQKKEIGS